MDIKGFEIIAHRANVDIPLHVGEKSITPPKENSLEAIGLCLNYGISMELDIWFKDKQWWLGHDKPETPFEPSNFSFNNRIYWHTKNIEAFNELITHNQFASHFFYHDIEKLAPLFDVKTREDMGYWIQHRTVERFWTAQWLADEPVEVQKKSIFVMNKIPNSFRPKWSARAFAGICTDEPIKLYNAVIQHGI